MKIAKFVGFLGLKELDFIRRYGFKYLFLSSLSVGLQLFFKS